MLHICENRSTFEYHTKNSKKLMRVYAFGTCFIRVQTCTTKFLNQRIFSFYGQIKRTLVSPCTEKMIYETISNSDNWNIGKIKAYCLHYIPQKPAVCAFLREWWPCLKTAKMFHSRVCNFPFNRFCPCLYITATPLCINFMSKIYQVVSYTWLASAFVSLSDK